MQRSRKIQVFDYINYTNSFDDATTVLDLKEAIAKRENIAEQFVLKHSGHIMDNLYLLRRLPLDLTGYEVEMEILPHKLAPTPKLEQIPKLAPTIFQHAQQKQQQAPKEEEFTKQICCITGYKQTIKYKLSDSVLKFKEAVKQAFSLAIIIDDIDNICLLVAGEKMDNQKTMADYHISINEVANISMILVEENKYTQQVSRKN